MDFFQRQDTARKNTSRLVVYFTLAVIGVVLCVYIASYVLFAGAWLKSGREFTQGIFIPKLFLVTTAATLAVIACGCMTKFAELSGGGGAVARSLGGEPVDPGTTDPDERRLLNVVEEMAIASGTPMPQVFVLDGERGINAFAAGHTPSDAAVAVTRGALRSLTRDELQGVIGHEFSHILNGDMRLNLRLMGVIFGIVCLVTVGRILLRVRSSGKNANPLPILGLVLILIGAVGAFFANLIQAAVSRQREFLADASAVQFTRNPQGLSGALQKLGSVGSELDSDHAQEASHLFFGNGVKSSFFNLFATHPPLEERIKAIDPTWDGTFKPLPAFTGEDRAHARSSSVPPIFGSAEAMGFGGLGGAIHSGTAESVWRKPPPLRPENILPDVGQPRPMHLRYAEQFREAIPEDVRLATREPIAAAALTFALLLDEDPSLHHSQLAELARRFPAAHAKLGPLARAVENVAARARLPLLSLALPALRNLEPEDYRRFTDTLQWLIESDGEVDLFEFTLQKIVQRHLAPQFGTTRRAIVQYYALQPLTDDCGVLLSTLARVGGGDDAAQQRAFQLGVPYLRAGQELVPFHPADRCNLAGVGTALDRLALAAPQIKKNVLTACVQVVGADGRVTEPEAELLRAVADTLDCPMPPFVTME